MPDSKEADTIDFVLPQNKGRQPPELYSAKVQVDVAGLSDRGKVRPKNEDHFLICRFGRVTATR